jgi:hypothetical protein
MAGARAEGRVEPNVTLIDLEQCDPKRAIVMARRSIRTVMS